MRVAIRTAIEKREEEKRHGSELLCFASKGFVDHLSPALKLIVNNIEIVRLVVNPNESVKELWPCVQEGCVAIQCKFCKAFTRHTIHSQKDITTIIENVGVHHIPKCCWRPSKESAIDKVLQEANCSIKKKQLCQEIQDFTKHFIYNMKRTKGKSTCHIPMVHSISTPYSSESVTIVQSGRRDKKRSRSKEFGVEVFPPFRPNPKRIGLGRSKAFDIKCFRRL